jgi:phosphoribosylglycinamide formyltransferase 2
MAGVKIPAEEISEAQYIANKITNALGGYGLFGVELFLSAKGVYFSEVSPRPHDTGMVTMATQDLSEFALHIRAILGYPIPGVQLLKPGASRTIKSWKESKDYRISGIAESLSIPNTQVRVFGKPETKVGRRMAVVLTTGESVEEAREQAELAAKKINITHG